MKVSQAIETRRSIKYFNPGHEISEAECEQLMQASLLSPTAFNIQNWRFVRVVSPALRAEIRKAAWDQPQITDASLLLVLCMDLLAWSRDPHRYWRHAPPEVSEQLVPDITDFYHGDEQLQRDEGMRSCGIVAQSLMLLAREMGYHSCAMDGFDFDRVAQLIRLPDDHEICMIITIGKAMREPWPRGGQLPLDEVYFTDRFPE